MYKYIGVIPDRDPISFSSSMDDMGCLNLNCEMSCCHVVSPQNPLHEADRFYTERNWISFIVGRALLIARADLACRLYTIRCRDKMCRETLSFWKSRPIDGVLFYFFNTPLDVLRQRMAVLTGKTLIDGRRIHFFSSWKKVTSFDSACWSQKLVINLFNHLFIALSNCFLSVRLLNTWMNAHQRSVTIMTFPYKVS